MNTGTLTYKQAEMLRKSCVQLRGVFLDAGADREMLKHNGYIIGERSRINRSMVWKATPEGREALTFHDIAAKYGL